jgi:hypothetical protein
MRRRKNDVLKEATTTKNPENFNENVLHVCV